MHRFHDCKSFAVVLTSIFKREYFFFFKFKKSSANNYVFTVHTTKACPRNQSEMDERSLALNCTESNGYTCLPDKNLNVLLEFCYKRARIAVPKGLTYSDLYIIEINAGMLRQLSAIN